MARKDKKKKKTAEAAIEEKTETAEAETSGDAANQESGEEKEDTGASS